MFKFIKQYAETIVGIEVYPMVSMMIFVLFFLIFVIDLCYFLLFILVNFDFLC
jgi:hypothetical protein